MPNGRSVTLLRLYGSSQYPAAWCVQEEGKAFNGIWFSCSIPSMEGHHHELNIGVSPNNTGAPRYLKITMKSGSLSIDLKVKQK
ncbi:MAG: BACON domain-containing protein [Bacteroidales bacterium]|nr:BACON domain-containing protein [Bacteroidales bacterium]